VLLVLAGGVRSGSSAPGFRVQTSERASVVVVLVLEVAGLVRLQASERGRDRGRLQADGRNGAEIHGMGHYALPNAPRYVRFTSAAGYFGVENQFNLDALAALRFSHQG
jgi:hypothetical protein